MEEETIVVSLFVILVLAIVIGVFYWNFKHPCIEYQKYCYYETHGTAIGFGPNIGGKGFATTVTPTTSKIYVECKENKNIPVKIKEEQKCTKRK